MKHPLLMLAAALLLGGLARTHAGDPAKATLLFGNLRKLGNSIPVDNPAILSTATPDGPKGLAAADFDGDGRNDLVAANADGSLAVVFGKAGGGLEPARFFPTGDARGLRDVIAADVAGDGRPEIIAAHPFSGKIYIFNVAGGAGSREFAAARELVTWPGARSVAAGDFDGDGAKDLAVAGAGDGFREYRGDGTGSFTALPALTGITTSLFREYSAAPVYTMQTWRRTGELRDRIALAFAGSDRVWFLESAGPGQAMAATSSLRLLENESVYDLAMAYLSAGSRASGYPDLITAATWSGEVFIRRWNNGSAQNPASYPTVPHQRLAVPGAPRALNLADVNGDTWPDLLVAARTGNSLSLFLNSGESFSLTSQMPAGSSPRDVVSADFDGNGMPDAAVINRVSEDLTVHRIDPGTGWFYQSPMVEPISSGASAASIVDLDNNGRGELIYLMPVTGEAIVRRLSAAMRWLPPMRYPMGARPQSLTTADVDLDGRLDLLTTRLGDGLDPGGMSYRQQLSDGTFGPLLDVAPPTPQGQPLLGEVARDFDGDGLLDRVAIYWDCRISFYQGTSTGLVHRRTELFLYESRSIAAMDLDGDGRLDLVGVGAFGNPAIIRNNGEWFTGGPYLKTELGGNAPLSGAYKVHVEDGNEDGYLDLTVFSKHASANWHGGPGLTFEFDRTTALAQNFDYARADFDGDGKTDTFALCPANTTAGFFKGSDNETPWWWLSSPSVPYAVPAARTLATGDLDGDGLPDLAGVGEYLWAVLSGSPAPEAVPAASPIATPAIRGVVINEMLASTVDFIPDGMTIPTDCVEIFNGSGAPVNLAGWKLRRDNTPEETAAGAPARPDFIFPNHMLAAGGLAVVYCTGKNNLPWQANFKLPESGFTLRLFNASGAEADKHILGAQEPDVSRARLFDGSETLVSNPFPSIGGTNYDNGNSNPRIELKGLDIDQIKQGKWRFRAQAWDENGMFTLAIYWREITTAPMLRSGMIPLYDDGMHHDGGSLDGVFAGDWDQSLPAGVPIEFYITGTDLNGESATRPDGPRFALPGQPLENYSLALPANPSGWEISEVVSRNRTGIRDGYGQFSDWVELRYAGLAATQTQDLFFSDSLIGFNPGKLFGLSNLGAEVPACSSHVVFLNGAQPDRAFLNQAAFRVSGTGTGDSIYLFRRLPSGATELVDAVKVPALLPDIAYARAGTGGPFVETNPTPGTPNAPVSGMVRLVPNAGAGMDCLFVFPGNGRVEASSNLQTWTVVKPWIAADGFEQVHREPVNSAPRYFRIR